MLAHAWKGTTLALGPCTCRHSTSSWYSTSAASSFASTSRSSLEYAPLQRPRRQGHDPPPTFDSLLPPSISSERTEPITRGRQRRRARSVSALPLAPASPRSRTSSRPAPRDPTQISPHLPLVTRERSHLLLSLRLALGARSPSPDATWEALARVLQYPTRLPDLPTSSQRTSLRVATDEYNPIDDPRQPIALSLAELRKVFDIFARARPRTYQGLTRLLVVAELLGVHADPHGVGSEAGGSGSTYAEQGRHSLLRPLRGDGRALRQKDIRALMLFAGGNIRSPRMAIETENALTLFGQIRGDVGVRTFNVLLNLASQARAWDVCDNVQTRMTSLHIEDDVATVGIRIGMMLRRGASLEAIWYEFVRGVGRFRDTGSLLWGSMVWTLARRGKMEDAMRVYDAMKRGEQVDLFALGPHLPRSDQTYVEQVARHEDGLFARPPRPDRATFEGLIQAFSHYGDLGSALAVMRDMLRSTPSLAPTHQTYASLFRGFTRHGVGPSVPGGTGMLASRHLHGGTLPTLRGNSLAHRETPLGALTRLDQARSRTTAESVSMAPRAEWTLAALESLFEAFLTSSAPSADEAARLPFHGNRTAPQSRQLFWLVLAYENLTAHDSRALLEMWNRVEATFGPRGRGGWRGWRVESRVQRKLEVHRRRLAILEAELERYDM